MAQKVIQTPDRDQRDSGRYKKVALERQQHNGEEVQTGWRRFMELEPKADEGDQCDGDDAGHKLSNRAQKSMVVFIWHEPPNLRCGTS